MNPDKWNALIEKGLRHMRFAVELYRLRAEGGRFFLHEHPNSSTSWKMPEVQKSMSGLQLEKTTAHMCRYGMKSTDESGGGRVKKPTGFLTNSEFLRDQLSKRVWEVTVISNISEVEPERVRCTQTNCVEQSWLGSETNL